MSTPRYAIQVPGCWSQWLEWVPTIFTLVGAFVCLAASAIATWDGPVVAVSVKRDLYDTTAFARAKRGEIAVFDPGVSTGMPTARWSPLERINSSSAALRTGRDRLVDEGMVLPTLVCDAEKLPFPDGRFDLASVAFGLRNMTHKDQAIAEMRRVLKPGGRLLVLEFSKVWKPLAPAYDFYSFKLLPMMGEKVAKDADSYRYLAESIRMHPDQESLKDMMEKAGLARVEYFNMTAGVVALHRGYKI